MTTKFYDDVYMEVCSEKTLQSNQKGFFMQFVNDVMNHAGEEWIKKVFGVLKTDRERISIIYRYEPVRTAVCDTLAFVQEIYRKKSAEVSQERRNTAEQAFQKGEKQKALALYSQSILRSPSTGENRSVDSGICLALALWGRSEVLMGLHEYNLALTDIQTALRECLYDSYRPEAFWRIGVCHKCIGEENKALISFGISQTLLEHDKQTLAELQRKFSMEYKHINKDSRSVPRITGEKHPIYVNASNKLCVKHAKGLGRFMTAKERIKTGDTLVVEPAYAACLLPEYFGTHCHHCFQRLISPVGCRTCASVAFCKGECRDIAISTYHQYECKYLDLLIGSGMSILAHIALRMISQSTLDQILTIYDHKDLEKVYSLSTNAKARTSKDFFQRTLMACFLLRCLQKSGYFPNRESENCIPTEDELKVGELLLLSLQILQFNAHEIYEKRCDSNHKFIDVKTVNIGVGIYPTVALFNHDCYPGVTRYFVGKNIVIHAIRPIGPDEVVAENYGPIFTRCTLAKRQKSLSGRYWFTCQCLACTQNWPSLDIGLENNPKRIRCPSIKCSYFFTLPTSSENIKCPRCKKNISLSDNISQLEICLEQLKEAFVLSEKEESEKGIQILIQAIETFHNVSTPPCREIHLGQELLSTFLSNKGNIHIYSSSHET